MAGEEEEEEWNLENTPTWSVATVCTVFVTIALLLVYALEKIEHRLKKAHRKSLAHALHKMKEELMLLGFISLLLTAFQNYVSSICIRSDVMDDWSPCHPKKEESEVESSPSEAPAEGRRRLLAYELWSMISSDNESFSHRRILSQNSARSCKPGHSPFISADTLHELHTFMFVLAVVHICYSLFAMLLASTTVNGWRTWEDEVQQQDSRADMREVVKSLSMHRQTSFVQNYSSKPWSRNWIFVWITCFFRQFGKSVRRADYLALRLGFITTHNTGLKFDFHSYMVRSLEDEYQDVVGISATLWMLVVLSMLFNVVGSNLYFWLSLVPAVLALLVGAKLQQVIASLALESAGFTRGGAYAGATLKPRDDLFWFRKPQLILHFIHFIFFQNAFQMATYLSFSWQFGMNSCLLGDKVFLYTRISIGLVVQLLCCYSTLPLYALVTQMGSQYKHSIFHEHVKDKIRRWRRDAKRNLREKSRSLEGTQHGSSMGLKRRSTDYDSTAETRLDITHEDKNGQVTHEEKNDHTRSDSRSISGYGSGLVPVEQAEVPKRSDNRSRSGHGSRVVPVELAGVPQRSDKRSRSGHGSRVVPVELAGVPQRSDKRSRSGHGSRVVPLERAEMPQRSRSGHGSRVVPVEQVEMPQRASRLPSLEITVSVQNDEQRFLIPSSPSRSATGALSVPKGQEHATTVKKFYQQLSLGT